MTSSATNDAYNKCALYSDLTEKRQNPIIGLITCSLLEKQFFFRGESQNLHISGLSSCTMYFLRRCEAPKYVV